MILRIALFTAMAAMVPLRADLVPEARALGSQGDVAKAAGLIHAYESNGVGHRSSYWR